MKHLIIYTHPNPNSLNGHFKNILVSHLEQSGHEIIVRDLYELGFNPVLSLTDLEGQLQGSVAEDVAIEQEWIRWAERITFIYPIWWTGLPAIMKGYIDRVFSYGFAYSYTGGIQKGLLKGKKVVIINSHGKSHEEYLANGLGPAISLAADKGMYSYCGLEIIKHLFFDKADRALSENIKEWEDQIRATFK